MTRPVSSLYTRRHQGLKKAIRDHIDKGCGQATDNPLVFFRADDIGFPSRRFQLLIDCFRKQQLPLCLATVPAWTTETRLAELYRLTGTSSSQWCWHQHGYTHRNFESSGKKQEFGPARPATSIATSLRCGRNRLQELLGEEFSPAFTPPWNRCSRETLKALVDLDFQAISRSSGARPKTLTELPDFQVNVDLHTRKEGDPAISLANLLNELEKGLASGLCGIMIHHQRMNGPAVELLDSLLQAVRCHPAIRTVRFNELLS